MSCLLPDPLKPAPGLQSCERSSLFHHGFVFEGREFRVYTVLFLLLLLLLSRFSHVRLCATPEAAAHQAPRPWDSPGKNTGVGCSSCSLVFFKNHFLYTSFEFPHSLSLCLSPTAV